MPLSTSTFLLYFALALDFEKLSLDLRNGTTATSTVWGKIQSNCKLSGQYTHMIL